MGSSVLMVVLLCTQAYARVIADVNLDSPFSDDWFGLACYMLIQTRLLSDIFSRTLRHIYWVLFRLLVDLSVGSCELILFVVLVVFGSLPHVFVGRCCICRTLRSRVLASLWNKMRKSHHHAQPAPECRPFKARHPCWGLVVSRDAPIGLLR